MRVFLNGTDKKNVVVLRTAEIKDMADRFYSEVMDDFSYESYVGSMKEFIVFEGKEYEAVEFFRSVIDQSALLRRVYQTLNGFVETVFLEYCKRKGITKMVYGNDYDVSWIQKVKYRQNLVDMILDESVNVVEPTWEKIAVSASKLTDELSEIDFPKDVAIKLLKDNGFVKTSKKKTLKFEYYEKVDNIDMNLGIDIVFEDLKKNSKGLFLQRVLELRDQLEDIAGVYDYMKSRLDRVSSKNETYTDLGPVLNGQYVEEETETETIVPINYKGLDIVRFLRDANVLSPSEMIEVVWSRSNIWGRNSVESFEDTVVITKNYNHN